jgi:glycosyltransferase involved in cell wall biosynthesis
MFLQKKPRLAILTIHPMNYGGVLTVLKIAYQFSARFFEPTLFCPSFDPTLSQSFSSMRTTPQIKNSEYFGMPTIEVGTQWPFWEPGHYQNSFNLWKEALKEYDYFFVVSGTVIAGHPLVLLDKKYIVWAATLYDDDRATRIKTLPLKEKIINTFAHPFMLSIEKSILKQAEQIGAMSKKTMVNFQEQLDEKRSKVLHIGVPVSQKTEHPFKDFHQETKTLIAVGRWEDPRKNVELLFRTFEIMYAHHPALHLYIVGNLPPEQIMEKYRSHSSFRSITTTGFLADTPLAELYKKADLMLITSDQEGLGIIGLEALSHGVPVVSTDCGGPTDFVLPGKTGYLVPINDPAAMAKAALSILADPVLAEKMHHNAIAHVAEHALPQKTEKLFQQMFCAAYPELQNLFIQEILS